MTATVFPPPAQSRRRTRPTPRASIKSTRSPASATAWRSPRLQPAGTSTPGNPGYPVDDRIRADGPQLTKAGFGFALADGSYGNAFFLDTASPPQYLEAHSASAARVQGSDDPLQRNDRAGAKIVAGLRLGDGALTFIAASRATAR